MLNACKEGRGGRRGRTEEGIVFSSLENWSNMIIGIHFSFGEFCKRRKSAIQREYRKCSHKKYATDSRKSYANAIAYVQIGIGIRKRSENIA